MNDPFGDLGIDRCTAIVMLGGIPALVVGLFVLVLIYVIGYKRGRASR